jgi:hypothetical protein
MPDLNYDNRRFRAVANSSGGDVTGETMFHYRQIDRIVWGTYRGGGVAFGTLVATVDDDGRLDMRYQQVAIDGTRKAGRCVSMPERLADGRIRLHERWTWTEGGVGAGTSVVEELEGAGLAG